MTTLVGRCSVKGCTTTVTTEQEHVGTGWETQPVAATITRQNPVGRRLLREAGYVCGEHAKFLTFKTLTATTTTGGRCDEQCWEARSASCRCSCGGQRHGGAWKVRPGA